MKAPCYGYVGRTLRVDLSSGSVVTEPSADHTARFLGGRGMALSIYWNEVSPKLDALDPGNRLIFSTGPICGVPGFAGSRWQVCGKSPVLNLFSYANIGGGWGAQLKFAGYDALVVQGRADSLVCLVIDDDKVALRPAHRLRGKGAIATRRELKEELGDSFQIVAVGPAGENLLPSAILLADLDSSGASGFGAVMGSKNLKAIAVRGNGKVAVADPDGAADLRKRLKALKSETWHWPVPLNLERIRKQICFGCINGCMRVTYQPLEGRSGKYFCESAGFYEVRSQRYYGDATEVSFQASKLCDDYGIDTRVVETMMMWLSRCAKAQILTDEGTGIPLSRMGSLEFMETLLRKMAFREGFGDILAEGTKKAAETVGKESDKLITDYMIRTGEDSPYGARMYLTTGLLYATEPRMPIQQLHEVGFPFLLWATRQAGQPGTFADNNYMPSEVFRAIAKRFWGSESAADFSTYDGKAACAVKIQNRQYAKECLILCDLSWPITNSLATEDHVGDPTLESQVCSVVTGMDVSEQELYGLGERVFNLQRAVLVREGRRGREHDAIEEFNFGVPLKAEFNNPECLVPGKDGEPFSRKGMVVDRNAFERMKDEYYEHRGWDVATGLQTRRKLDDLGLSDVAVKLAGESLLAAG